MTREENNRAFAEVMCSLTDTEGLSRIEIQKKVVIGLANAGMNLPEIARRVGEQHPKRVRAIIRHDQINKKLYPQDYPPAYPPGSKDPPDDPENRS